ncbi:MAG: acyl carrier protein [Halioglobus sp.]
MITLDELKTLVGEVLQIPDRLSGMGENDVLLGGVPEFDSMAVVSVLTVIEENYGVMIDDDEVSAENFETLGTLLQFINSKVG